MGMLLAHHLRRQEAAETEPDFPEGEPSEDWTGKQLKAYAAEHDIDLDGATRKADIRAAIDGA